MELYAPQKLNDAILVGVFDSGSDEWLDARKNGIGGSDVGAIMGVNPWESAYSLWAKKSNLIPEEKLTSWRVRFGNKFELPILEMWQEDNPDWTVYHTGTYRHATDDFLMANPDAIAKHNKTGELMIIEVKTSGRSWEEIPPHYQAQVMHYMSVMGIHKSKLIGVIGWDWFEQDLDYDEFVARIMRDKAKEFWKCVTDGVKPDWDGSEATYRTIRSLNKDIDQETVEVSLGSDLIAAQKAADEAEVNLRKLKSQIMDEIGSARYAVTYVNGKEVRVASRQMRAGLPTLIVKR